MQENITNMKLIRSFAWIKLYSHEINLLKSSTMMDVFQVSLNLDIKELTMNTSMCEIAANDWQKVVSYYVMFGNKLKW